MPVGLTLPDLMHALAGSVSFPRSGDSPLPVTFRMGRRRPVWGRVDERTGTVTARGQPE